MWCLHENWWVLTDAVMQVRQPRILSRQATKTTVCMCICMHICVYMHVYVWYASTRPPILEMCKNRPCKIAPEESPTHLWELRPQLCENRRDLGNLSEKRPLVGEWKIHSPTLMPLAHPEATRLHIYIYIHTNIYMYIWCVFTQLSFLKEMLVSIQS